MVRAYKCSFKAVAKRFLKRDSVSDLEDYSQICWLAVFKIRNKGFEGDSLRRISSHEAIAEWIRVYGRRSKWVGRLTVENLDEMPAKRPVAVSESQLDDRWLAMLTPTMRNVVQAVIVDGMSHKGAAEKLGLTELTVRTVVCRAKQRIRATI